MVAEPRFQAAPRVPARAQPGLCADAGLPSEMRALGSVVDDLFDDADELAFDEFCERMGGLSGAAL